MDPNDKTPQELMELAAIQYRAMNYEISTALYSAALAKAYNDVIEKTLVRILEILEAPKVAPAPKAKRTK